MLFPVFWLVILVAAFAAIIFAMPLSATAFFSEIAVSTLLINHLLSSSDNLNYLLLYLPLAFFPGS